jgi:hypothetical protein
MKRQVTHRYQDPLDLVWLKCAERLGMNVERSPEVYAAWDGAGTLTLSTSDDFDPDDSLAQLIYHEICHSLVAGPRGRNLADWGLSNTDDSDLVYEHACHRVQAALAAPHGLRAFFAVTTDWRPYWEALPQDPLADGDDPAILFAREAFRRAQLEPTRSALQAALEQTAQIARIVQQMNVDTTSLWSTVRAKHPTGLLMGPEVNGKCGECAWSYGQKTLRCRRSSWETAKRAIIQPHWDGCESFEARFSESECRRCAACCREGYDRVELRRNDVVLRRHPELVSTDESGVNHIARPDGKCRALETGPDCYTCKIYELRPRACAELTVSSDACLAARRRAGITR